jgi:hypothetical protein
MKPHPLRSRPALRLGLAVAALALLAGCATPPPAYDYSAFRKNRPASMLVLSPVNDTPDVKASNGVLATTAYPLAEAGYYVLPAGLVSETFRQNGLTGAADIHEVAPARLREIFGADAAVYMRVKKYGTTYMVVGSETRVTVEAKIVDLRSGDMLWSGIATASSQESQGSNQAGLLGLLVQAVVGQIVGTVTDASFNYAAIANQRLLGAPIKNGILSGPRSPQYQKD